jgi:hypothetical protein
MKAKDFDELFNALFVILFFSMAMFIGYHIFKSELRYSDQQYKTVNTHKAIDKNS